MGDFVRDLKIKVEKSLSPSVDLGDVNPLVVIGLTEALLDLGLNEDEIFAVVKGYSRQLVGQIHPDRESKSVSEDRQRQIFQAFEVLDDRKRFSKALIHFRSLKSDDRKEVKLLREALSNTKDQLSLAMGREVTLVKEQRELDRNQRRFNREEQELRQEIPLLNGKIQELTRISEKHFNRVKYWRNRCNSVTSYVYSTCADQKTLGPGVHVFDARWVAVASVVGLEKGNQSEKRNLPSVAAAFDPSGHVLPAFVEASQGLGITAEELSQIALEFNKISNSLKEDKSWIVDKYELVLSLIQLAGGNPNPVYGWMTPFIRVRVLGSISPQETSVGLNEFSILRDREYMFEKMLPNITLGGLLVMGTMLREKRYPGSTPTQFMRFDTKHQILGVG